MRTTVDLDRSVLERAKEALGTATYREGAVLAGRMGAGVRQAGAPIPLPGLPIGATAVRLDVPLLTCDSDFRRGMEAGGGSGGSRWLELRLHPASM